MISLIYIYNCFFLLWSLLISSLAGRQSVWSARTKKTVNKESAVGSNTYWIQPHFWSWSATNPARILASGYLCIPSLIFFHGASRMLIGTIVTKYMGLSGNIGATLQNCEFNLVCNIFYWGRRIDAMISHQIVGVSSHKPTWSGGICRSSGGG